LATLRLIVAQIQHPEKIKGSLFTVLPLPILTSQPVHIHGLFSISPDRARLYQFSDRSAQDQIPARWNNCLLQESVPAAWARLLSYLAYLHPHQPAFGRWPQSTGDAQDPLSNATANLIGIINKECLALWPTEVGYVTANKGLLDTGDESEALRDALRETKAPVVYIPEHLRQEAKKLFKDQVLCPRSLSHFLKHESSRISLWSDQTKHRILEYLLSEPGFIDYDGLELFPFQDGKYRSIGDYTAFIHRDEFEKDLFYLEDFRNLNLDKLSTAAQRALKDGCKNSTIHPSIRHRSANSLRDYCMSTIFKNLPEDQDMVVLGGEPTALVSKVWTWLSMQRINILDESISCLWLLPLSNGQYRKVKPRSSSSQVYFAPAEEIGALRWKFDAKSSARLLPLLDTKPTGSVPRLASILTKSPDIMSNLFISNASSIVLFLQWLHKTSPLVDNGADEDKLLIARLVASHLPQSLTSPERGTVVRALRSLQIFQKISWQTKGDRMLVGSVRCILAVTN
jgi:sacsin